MENSNKILFLLSRMRKYLLYLFLTLPFTAFSQADTVYDAMQQKVFSVIEKVKSEQRYTDALDAEALTSLPIGIIKEIGTTRYIIAIDSAVFKPNGAYFNAYMAVEFPNTNKKIAFAAKNIKFNPSGVIGGEQSKLVLVSKHSFSINPNVKLNLLPDGGNYIEWNCEGFQSVNLRGEFEFSGSRMIPLVNDVADPTQSVKATFEIHTNDIHHFITSVSITPFTLTGLKDWSFKVTNAVVDMSEISNYPSMTFPMGYVMDYPSYPQMWTGFYLRELEVKLPPELSKHEEPTRLIAQNLLIDASGFTGHLQANNVFTVNDGNMSGWGFSLDAIGVDFLSNRLTAGNMSGKIKIPAMKNNGLEYSALLSYIPSTQQTNFGFTVSTQENISFDAFSAKVDLDPTSTITVQKQNGKFLPRAVLTGRIAFEHANASTAKLDFQNLTFVTSAPYLIAGTFGVVGNASSTSNKAAGFEVSISNLRLLVNASQPKIALDASVNFMDGADFSFTGITTVQFGANVGLENGLQSWSFAHVSIGRINLEVETQPFYLKGEIKFYENDPVFGKGFDGRIIFRLKNVMDENFEVNAQFGKTNYRYFYVDAYVPFSIPLGMVQITRLNGGLYYHMRPVYNNASQFYSNLNTPPSPDAHRTKYLPDNSISVGFKAGVSYKYASSEKALNGDAMLEVAFSSAGGLDFIRFDGKAYMLATVAERQSKPAPAMGTVLIQYDNIHKIFDANLNFTVNTQGINGYANSKIHIEPSIWFVCVGRPTLPASLSLFGFGTASAYVMVGNQLEPMAPVPAQVASIVSSSGLNNLRSESALSNASGFVGGVRFASSFSNEKEGQNEKVENFKIYAYFAYGVGFDMMLANYGANAHCSGSSSQVGMNGWVASGQLYCYLQGGVGVRGKALGQDFDITILSGTVAAILAGKLPNPSYLYGALACQYSILGIINGSFNFDFELGNNCTIVN